MSFSMWRTRLEKAEVFQLLKSKRWLMEGVLPGQIIARHISAIFAQHCCYSSAILYLLFACHESSISLDAKHLNCGFQIFLVNKMNIFLFKLEIFKAFIPFSKNTWAPQLYRFAFQRKLFSGSHCGPCIACCIRHLMLKLGRLIAI